MSVLIELLVKKGKHGLNLQQLEKEMGQKLS